MSAKLDFAWFLFPDGISLLHRQAKGHWAKLGTAALDGGDIGGDIAALRKQAGERGGEDFRAKLVLPGQQVLYTAIAAPGPDDPARLQQIRTGLNGLTPYPVDDLVYDWRIRDADMVQVAVVARETLEEAEAFAREHRLNPAAFVAIPEGRKFLGEPLFGLPDCAPADLHRKGLSPEPAAIVLGPDQWQPPKAQDAGDTGPGTGRAGVFSTSGLGAMQGGRSAAPSPQGRRAAPDGPAPDTNTDDPIRLPAGFGARRRGSDPAAPAPEASAGRTPRFGVPAPTPAARAPDAPAATGAGATGRGPTVTGADATDDGAAKPPQPTEAAAAADAPATPETSDASADATNTDDGRRHGPEATGLRAPADRSDRGPRPAGGKAATGARAERGGKAKAPKRGRQLRVGPRSGPARGDGPTPADASPPGTAAKTSLRPDTLAPAPMAENPGVAVASGARSSDLAAALAAPVPQSGDAPGGSEGSPIGQLAERLRRRGPARPGLAQSGRPPGPAAAADDDAVMTGGMLARRADVTQPGGSARTGLILTLILILLLALVAIWSALFLPNSQVARAIWGGEEPVLAEPAPEPAAGATGTTAEAAAADAVAPAAAAPQAPGADAAAPGAADAEAIAAAELDRFLGDGGGSGLGEDAIGEADPALQIARDGSIEAPAQPTADELADAEPPQEATLPDIDADLPMPTELQPLPGRDETEAFYAVTGIWQRPPDLDAPSAPAVEAEDALYRVAIDAPVGPTDPYALARPDLAPDTALPRRVPNPPPAGQTVALDANGNVVPLPGDGVVTPEGVRVIAGRPAVAPGPRGGEALPPAPDPAPAAPDAAGAGEDGGPAPAALAAIRPVPRPDDLDQQRERQLLGGLTRSELGAIAPEPRPASVQELAAEAEAEREAEIVPDGVAPGAIDAAVAEASAATAADASEAAEAATAPVRGTELAISVSPRPAARPARFEQIVAEARAAQPARDDAVQDNEPDAVIEPDIPSAATVTRAATQEDAINLRQVALIGISGTPSDREALVRLPSGRFVRVGIGDRLDRGRVAAIGEASLQYVRNGRSITLEMP